MRIQRQKFCFQVLSIFIGFLWALTRFRECTWCKISQHHFLSQILGLQTKTMPVTPRVHPAHINLVFDCFTTWYKSALYQVENQSLDLCMRGALVMSLVSSVSAILMARIKAMLSYFAPTTFLKSSRRPRKPNREAEAQKQKEAEERFWC